MHTDPVHAAPPAPRPRRRLTGRRANRRRLYQAKSEIASVDPAGRTVRLRGLTDGTVYVDDGRGWRRVRA